MTINAFAAWFRLALLEIALAAAPQGEPSWAIANLNHMAYRYV
jgi:hypothetical protein